MDFSIYKNGSTYIVDSPTGGVEWGKILETEHSHRFKLIPVLFSNSYKFNLGESFQYTIDKIGTQNYGAICIDVNEQGEDSKNSIWYCSNRPFCVSDYSMVKMIGRFLTDLQYFDSLKDAELLFDAKDPIEYSEPTNLKSTLMNIISLYAKYYMRENFPLKFEMKRWIESALHRFGYTIQKPSQDSFDNDFVEIGKTLNSLGYILTKS